MLELGTEPRFRQPSYNGTPAASLWRATVPRLVALAALAPVVLAGGACSYKLDSVGSRDADRPEATALLSNPGQAD